MIDPYIAMLGGEFVTHGPQQVATMRVTSPDFPGIADQGLSGSFAMNEEWYALKNFAKDMHVILVQETEGMKGQCYQRAPFPATWARMHGAAAYSTPRWATATTFGTTRTYRPAS